MIPNNPLIFIISLLHHIIYYIYIFLLQYSASFSSTGLPKLIHFLLFWHRVEFKELGLPVVCAYLYSLPQPYSHKKDYMEQKRKLNTMSFSAPIRIFFFFLSVLCKNNTIFIFLLFCTIQLSFALFLSNPSIGYEFKCGEVWAY